MRKCNHAKDNRGHCWVHGCDNNRLEHWPFKPGAKRPADVYKPHDPSPINAVHKAASIGTKVHEDIERYLNEKDGGE